MQLFRCESCGHRVYFENTQCTQCGTALGFDPDRFEMSAIRPLGDGRWQSVATGRRGSGVYRQCSNYAVQGVCNWLLPDGSPEDFCVACRLNQTIPDLSIDANKVLWARLEEKSEQKTKEKRTMEKMGTKEVKEKRETGRRDEEAEKG